MDQQNIDRLFREKLDQLEVAPSTNAWSKVERQIRPKKTPIIYWVAASISLILISYIVWPDTGALSPIDSAPIASQVNHPVQPSFQDIVLPEVNKTEEKESSGKEIEEIKKRPVAPTQLANNVVDAIEEDEVITDVQTIENKTMVATEEVEAPQIINEVQESVTKPAFRTVKITYIASNDQLKSDAQNRQKSDSTGALKKFISFAEKIDPGDVLADIKTAKDNLLNGGLKSKKDRNSL